MNSIETSVENTLIMYNKHQLTTLHQRTNGKFSIYIT